MTGHNTLLSDNLAYLGTMISKGYGMRQQSVHYSALETDQILT